MCLVFFCFYQVSRTVFLCQFRYIYSGVMHLFSNLFFSFHPGYLTRTPSPKKFRWRLLEQSYRVDSELVDSLDSFGNVVPYVRLILQAHLIHASTLLNQVQ